MSSLFSIDKLEYALDRHKMLENKHSILVGFSGGPDSSLLLRLLSQINGLTVAAAHLNHGIRGDEALRDEMFCKRFCESSHITLYVGHADVPSEAKKLGMTLEEAARRKRYEFLERTAREEGYELIATAHNADDNLETVLFHLVRGSALDGLCGIPPVRDNIIRPLLYYSKAEVIAACNELKVPYILDSTNDDNAYTRNKIRNTVIPRLKEINPSLCSSVTSMIDSLTKDRDYLADASDGYSFNDGRRSLSLLHDSILSRIILRELKKCNISAEKTHIDALIKAIRSDKRHIKISVSGAEFICDRDLIYIETSDTERSFNFKLTEGIHVIDENSAIAVFAETDSDIALETDKLKNVYSFSIQTELNSAKIDSGAVIRSRAYGDKYLSNGITKKVKKMIQSLKLPMRFTDNLPFIAVGSEIAYVPFFRPSDGFEATDDGLNTKIIYFYNL